jgi:peptidoglycan/LPS O-acetylase OafA/YrhL
LVSFAVRYAFYLGDPTPAERLGRFSLPGTFYYFVAGMGIALLRVAWQASPPRWISGVLGSSGTWTAASIALWAAVGVSFGAGSQWNWTEGLAAPASALLVGACVLPLRHGVAVRVLDLRVLALVGVASYSLYLWHVPLLTWLDRRHYGFVHHFGLLGATAVPLVLAVAWASYRCIEEPFLRLRRRWGSTV